MYSNLTKNEEECWYSLILPNLRINKTYRAHSGVPESINRYNMKYWKEFWVRGYINNIYCSIGVKIFCDNHLLDDYDDYNEIKRILWENADKVSSIAAIECPLVDLRLTSYGLEILRIV